MRIPPSTSQELQQAQQILKELQGEVAREEGTLAYGQKLGLGGEALAALRETNISFGNPYDNLVRLTPELFDAAGVSLNALQRRQMGESFDFYYMTLVASLLPRRGAQFQLVECQLDFGPDEIPIVQTIFPQARWRPVLQWGGGMALGLNGNLDWEAGLPEDAMRALSSIAGAPQANIKNQNELKAHIVVPDYSFRLGRPEITATGEGNAYAIWRFQNPELHETHSIRFIVVFKVPRGLEQIELAGRLVVEPRMSWLTAQLTDVFSELSDRFQAILRKRDGEREGAERLPIGAHEKWLLQLPATASGDG